MLNAKASGLAFIHNAWRKTVSTMVQQRKWKEKVGASIFQTFLLSVKGWMQQSRTTMKHTNKRTSKQDKRGRVKPFRGEGIHALAWEANVEVHIVLFQEELRRRKLRKRVRCCASLFMEPSTFEPHGCRTTS